MKLFVNGREVEVEAGKNLIDAIGAVGIEIPHLCYHPALGADGNCRMCLVGIEDGRPPLVPACKTPAVEGMKVQLDTEKIKKIQRDVLEFQLINHPVDCPVCDQAGECSLQDYYMTYGGEKSRMHVPQVAKGKKMDMGAGVLHDQERCVLCGRCVRFTRQITKTGELGIVNRTDYARVAVFPGRPLDNRYALNIVDLCPVGAMTAADFRFRQRVWFLKTEEGVCRGCSKGCSIYVDHNREKYKDDVIFRLRPRHNDQVNGYFMCDEGRMSYKAENEGRLSQALMGERPTAFDAAFEAAVKELKKAENILVLLSPNCTLEEMIAVRSLAEEKNARLFGYADAYVKEGDGDDYLVRDDKSANRKGLEMLHIDTSEAAFKDAVNNADLLLIFNNDRFMLKGARLLKGKRVIAVATHETALTKTAAISMPAASWSETAGSVVNIDGVLQTFGKAVRKNEEPADMIRIAALLGGPISDINAARRLLSESGVTSGDILFDHIPAEGYKLQGALKN